MKKILSLLMLLVILSATATAQTDTAVISFFPPNYEKIEQATLDKNSDLYYPKLLKRFAKADTTMGLAEMQALYFGYIYQPDFAPYSVPDELSEIRTILNTKQELEPSDFEKVVSLADKVIKKKPTEIPAYYYKYVALSELADKADAAEIEKTLFQVQGLFAAISYSGDGTCFSSAFHISSVSHSYFCMRMFRFVPLGQELLYDKEGAYDAFPLEENEFGVDTLYFRVDKCMSFWKFDDIIEESINSKPVKEVTIPFNSKFELEIVKTKKKNSTFKIISIEEISSDTLICDREKLFDKEIPENHIVGYFTSARHSETSNRVTQDLIFVGNLSKHNFLNFDTEIRTLFNSSFTPTSNSGIMKNVMMIEEWNDPLLEIRISNLRTAKK